MGRPWSAGEVVLKDKLIADLTADVSGTVRVGEVSLNWLHPVTAFDLSVTDDAGKPVLSAKKSEHVENLARFRAEPPRPGHPPH